MGGNLEEATLLIIRRANMSSSTSGVQASNQTMVTFLTQTSPTDQPVTQQRVFDFEITREAQTYYENQMSIIQYALLDGRAWDPTTGVGGTLTPQESLDAVRAAIAALNSWSQYKYVDANGMQQETWDPATAPFTTASTMSRYMAQGLDTLIRTMNAAGINPLQVLPDYPSWGTALVTIRSDDLSTSPIYNIRSVLSTALSAAANAVIAGDSSTQSQSIQQLLMVDYVASGNEILYGEMNQLQTAVNLNQQILSYLNSLQDLMNQKDPQHFLMNLQQLNSTSPNYAQFEKETFGDQILGTTPKFTDATLSNYVALMAIQTAGLDPTDPLVLAQYNLISNDTQFLSLCGALTDTSSGSAILDAANTQNYTIIPTDIATKYNLTAAEQTAVLAYMSGQTPYPAGATSVDVLLVLQTAGLDPTDPAIQTEFGLTSQDVSDYAIILTIQDAGLDPTDATVQATYNLIPRTVATSFYSLCQTLTDASSGTAILNVANTQGFTIIPPTIAALYGLNADKQAAILAYMSTGTISSDLTYADANPYPLGATSVAVLLSLHAAGLDPTSSAIQSEFGLTSQDVSDYAIIQTILTAGLDPTDETVQTEYGLVSRSVAANGTSPQALVDIVTGKFENSGSGLQQIIDNLTALIAKAQQYVDPQSGASVVSELQRILLDFQGAGSIQTWVTNFANQNEGAYQAHLNNGITASQALNDTEREQLQQVMFVYQEFYQSATSMLSSLNQLLQSIASNISSQ